MLLGILAGAFAIRLGWGLTLPSDDAALSRLPDQQEYLSLGRNLADGNGLQFHDPRFNDTLYAYRTPGYPLVLAALRGKVAAIRITQAALDTGTALAAYLLARALVDEERSRRAGLMAAGFVACNPFLTYFTGLVLTETLFTSLLVWGMLLLIVGGRGARLRDDSSVLPMRGRGTLVWILGGVTLALSALVRPSAAPLTVLMGYAAAFVNRPGPKSYQFRAGSPIRWPLPVGSTMLLVTALVLFPWALRNHKVLGRWIWTTTNEGITLYDGFNPDADGGSNQKVFLDRLPQLLQMNEVARSDYLSAAATYWISKHPREAAVLAIRKAGRTWSPVPLSGEFGSVRNQVVAAAYFVPFVLCVLIGIRSVGMRPAAKVFLLLPAIYFTAVHMASVGSLRYRIPVEPPMAVLAGLAFGRSAAHWKRAETRVDDEQQHSH